MKSNDKTINRKFINIEHRSKKYQIEKKFKILKIKKVKKLWSLESQHMKK